jgi:DNA repair protein RecN (Recombination protein N)
MLSELHIENLGVIEKLDLSIGEGLVALTGETGAGKTMLSARDAKKLEWKVDLLPTRAK